MTALTLSLAEQDLDAALASGVVARIHSFTAADATAGAEPSVKEVVIPATRTGGLTVPVQPGRYQVQAILPTGKIIQQTAVVKDGETVPVVFETGEATRSWLGWQSQKSEVSEPAGAADQTPPIIFNTGTAAGASGDDPGLDTAYLALSDPDKRRALLQTCESFLINTKLPFAVRTGLYRLPLAARLSRGAFKTYPEVSDMRGAVLDFSRVLSADGDLRSDIRMVYPRLQNTFQRFDTAVADLATSGTASSLKTAFAWAVQDAISPLRDALGLVKVDPQFRGYVGDDSVESESLDDSSFGSDFAADDTFTAAPPEHQAPVLSLLQQPALTSPAETWQAFQSGIDGRDVVQRLSLTNEPPLPSPETLRGPAQQQRWTLREEKDLDPARRWLNLSIAGGEAFAAYPLPWFDRGSSNFVQLEVLADEAPDRRGSALQVTLRDPTLGGLLAYLEHGKLSSARAMVDALDSVGLINQTIADKVANPLAACAAAYVGLAIFEPEERERWDGWLPNIATMFPWIPDGPILHARRILNRPRSPTETQQVLPSLKEAYGRGIPFFSAGVQHLRDMLSLFSTNPDVKPMLETVSGVLSRVDRYQALTVIRFPAAKGN